MNQWLNKIERKLGRYAVPNLMNYVVILYAVGGAGLLAGPGALL